MIHSVDVFSEKGDRHDQSVLLVEGGVNSSKDN